MLREGQTSEDRMGYLHEFIAETLDGHEWLVQVVADIGQEGTDKAPFKHEYVEDPPWLENDHDYDNYDSGDGEDSCNTSDQQQEEQQKRLSEMTCSRCKETFRGEFWYTNEPPHLCMVCEPE